MAKKKKIKYIYSVGRRKESVARVRLYKGKKENQVNDMLIAKFFEGKVFESMWKKPFRLTDTLGKLYVTVKVMGGGKKGQLDATVHGIAKAISLFDPDKYRAILKKEGLLTRDARVRERRKIDTGGKARRKKQSPKR